MSIRHQVWSQDVKEKLKKKLFLSSVRTEEKTDVFLVPVLKIWKDFSQKLFFFFKSETL